MLPRDGIDWRVGHRWFPVTALPRLPPSHPRSAPRPWSSSASATAASTSAGRSSTTRCALVAGRGLYRGYHADDLAEIGIAFGLLDMPALADAREPGRGGGPGAPPASGGDHPSGARRRGGRGGRRGARDRRGRRAARSGHGAAGDRCRDVRTRSSGPARTMDRSGSRSLPEPETTSDFRVAIDAERPSTGQGAGLSLWLSRIRTPSRRCGLAPRSRASEPARSGARSRLALTHACATNAVAGIAGVAVRRGCAGEPSRPSIWRSAST